MNWLIPALFLTILFGACNTVKEKSQHKMDLSGNWRALIYMQGDTLPFNFSIEPEDSSYTMFLINGEERLKVEGLEIRDDSLFASMHIFDTEIRAKIGENRLEGTFTKNYAQDYQLPFTAEKGLEFRFSESPKSEMNIDGRWEVQFGSDIEDSVKSIGEFRQNGSRVEGTFLTITGDYRFLEGELDGNRLKLSCFDGEHAFLFDAEIDENGEMNGVFRSGKSWNETWTARRNDSITLSDPHSLTYLKEGYESVTFAFPNMNGDTVRYPSTSFDDIVVLIQILGTWCPNCMDETRFLSSWYKENRDRGVEIFGVAFEKKPELSYVRQRVEKIRDKLGADYQFLYGGLADKKVASDAFPMLNHVISYPTLIIIDRKGQVRKIHTGFAGPGTGIYYENFTTDFKRFMNSLLEE
jgi:thiol-disulfide isomerase/thioredoxin